MQMKRKRLCSYPPLFDEYVEKLQTTIFPQKILRIFHWKSLVYQPVDLIVGGDDYIFVTASMTFGMYEATTFTLCTHFRMHEEAAKILRYQQHLIVLFMDSRLVVFDIDDNCQTIATLWDEDDDTLCDIVLVNTTLFALKEDSDWGEHNGGIVTWDAKTWTEGRTHNIQGSAIWACGNFLCVWTKILTKLFPVEETGLRSPPKIARYFRDQKPFGDVNNYYLGELQFNSIGWTIEITTFEQREVAKKFVPGTFYADTQYQRHALYSHCQLFNDYIVTPLGILQRDIGQLLSFGGERAGKKISFRSGIISKAIEVSAFQMHLSIPRIDHIFKGPWFWLYQVEQYIFFSKGQLFTCSQGGQIRKWMHSTCLHDFFALALCWQRGTSELSTLPLDMMHEIFRVFAESVFY